MTGSLHTIKGKCYAVYRDDNETQRWVPLDLPVEGNNKRKALKKLQQVLADAEKSKTIATSNTQFVDCCFDSWIRSFPVYLRVPSKVISYIWTSISSPTLNPKTLHCQN